MSSPLVSIERSFTPCAARIMYLLLSSFLTVDELVLEEEPPENSEDSMMILVRTEVNCTMSSDHGWW